jgi:hypothetical protein
MNFHANEMSFSADRNRKTDAVTCIDLLTDAKTVKHNL